MHRNRSICISLLLLGLLMVLLAGPAVAHSIVKRTEPRIDAVIDEPPRRVLMEFNEPVESAFGAIRVFDTKGRRVDVGRAGHPRGEPAMVLVALRPNLPGGTYIVSWRIISADSHPIQEAFLFHVGQPGRTDEGAIAAILTGQTTARPIEGFVFGVARWVGFVGMLLLAGALAFLPIVWRRRGLVLRPREVEDRFSARWRTVIAVAWMAALISTVAAFVLQGAVGAGVAFSGALSPAVLSEVSRTRFGVVHIAKLGLLLLGAAVWLIARRGGRMPLSPGVTSGRSLGGAAVQVPIPAWFLVLQGLLLSALLATPGLSGHAGSTRPVSVNLAADLVHMAAAGVWIGGLVTLLAVAFPSTRHLGDAERARVMAPVVARFSQVALVAVAVLVSSGLVRSFLEVRATRALFGSSYGLVLLAKLATFAPLLVLGGINKYWTRPRIDRAAASPEPSMGPLRTLRRLVALEVGLGAVVLAITAFLVVLPPARVEAGLEGPYVTEVAVGPQRADVMVDPNRAGENEVHISLASAEGLPAEADEVRVLFRLPERGIGPIEAMAEQTGHGAFMVEGHQLSVPGTWEIEIIVVLDRFTQHRAIVEVPVNP